MDYYYYSDPPYGYSPGYSSSADAFKEILLILFSVLFAFLIVLLIWSIVSYILTGVSLYKMAKDRNFKYAWLAWIPLASGYLLGALINDKVKIGALKIPHAAICLPLILTVTVILAELLDMLPAVGGLLAVLLCAASAIYIYAAYFRLYKIYNPKKAVLFTVLSIILPFLAPFFLFSLRNKAPDFTAIDPLEDDPVNPRSILSLGFGILGIVTACLQSQLSFLAVAYNPLFLGAAALLFGILALREQRAQGKSLTLPVAGIVLGGFNILLALLLPVMGLALSFGDILNSPDSLQNYLPYNDTSPYPFI
ncbi:MAG: hypothetical protein Q4C55_02755 [Eubacterium sp.]|nr:hypothetical protein [Eubacterium sp.]